MGKTLKGLTIPEVDEIIRSSKNVKEAAEKIGVAVTSVYQFRSENMKSFKQLKAQREQGFVVEDAPVIKTKPVKKPKTASQIEVKIESEGEKELKVENNKLNKRINELELSLAAEKDAARTYRAEIKDLERSNEVNNETIDNQAEQIKKLNEQAVKDNQEIKELSDKVADREQKALNMKDMLEKKHKTQLEHQQQKIDGQAKLLEAAGKDVEQMRNNLIKERENNAQLQDALKQTEESFHNSVIEYEATIKDLQMQLADKTVAESAGELAEVMKNTALVPSPIPPAEEKVIEFDVVNKPAHYNFGDIEVIDYIEQVADQYPGKVAVHIGNVLKYVSRAPHKNGIEDLKKADYYLRRAILNAEQLEQKETAQ